MNANFRIGRSYKVISGTLFAYPEQLHTYIGYDKFEKVYRFRNSDGYVQVMSRITLRAAELVDNLYYVRGLYAKSN